ncbi:unnamed protein product [Adineta steineri]|uniref:DNA-dependent protein kinase catalytic subunit CC3 domain-containing protein n=1 Tax=Adineta steineri TaxID=433720 RepID=A0A818LFA0_9BILA|nr:unnamed protein product [Adineta steineri]
MPYITYTFTADCFPLKIEKSTLIKFYNKYIYKYVSLFFINQFNTELDLTPLFITSSLINKSSTYRLIDYMYTILNKNDVFGLNSSIKKKILNIKISSTMYGKELTKYITARTCA